MRKTRILLGASTALTAVIGTTALNAMEAVPDGSPWLSKAIYRDAFQSAPLILASDDDDDDDDDHDGDDDDDDDDEKHGSKRDHDDDDEDCDDDEEDDDCRGGAPNPVPAGSVAPPQNGLFGNGAPPQAQVN